MDYKYFSMSECRFVDRRDYIYLLIMVKSVLLNELRYIGRYSNLVGTQGSAG
jgi:hypothetical protein